MKTAPKMKAEKSSPKLKAATKARRPASKPAPSNGKHPPTTYEHAPIGIVESSPDGKYLRVNEEFCRITGYEKQELLERGIKDITHEDDYPIDIKLHQQLVEGEIPFYRLEKRYIRKDGGIIWVELTRSIIRDGSENPLYTIGVVLDMSERKQVEKVLRESVERLRLATGAARMFTWEWDFQKKFYTVADNFSQVLGFSADLLPKGSLETVQRLTLPEDAQAVLEVVTKAIEGHGDLDSLQCRVVNPENGQVVWLEVNAKIVYDHEGNPERMLGVAQNITESKQAEKRLVLLSEISESVRRLEDPNELLFTISKAVGEHLQVKRCLFNEIDLENDLEIVHRDYCRGVESVAGIHKNSDYSSVTSAEMAVGKTVVNYDSKMDPRTALDYERSYVPHGERAYVTVPLMRENRWVASLWVSDDKPRQWSKEEVSLLETIAERTWIAVEKLRIDTALRASEALYRTIARSIPGGGIYVLDKDMRYLVADGAVTEAFGLSREMLEGRTVSEVFSDEQSARMTERLQRNFAGVNSTSKCNRLFEEYLKRCFEGKTFAWSKV